MSNYGSGSNNIHFDSPPIMMDGRNFANWQPGGAVNEEIRRKENITTNWQYRRFLTNNADEIIKKNQEAACGQNGSCPSRYHSVQNSRDGSRLVEDTTSKTTPYLYKSCESNKKPHGFETSNQKNLYLTEQQLQARMSIPTLTQYQLLRRGLVNYN